MPVSVVRENRWWDRLKIGRLEISQPDLLPVHKGTAVEENGIRFILAAMTSQEQK